jgi:hypothetical protein
MRLIWLRSPAVSAICRRGTRHLNLAICRLDCGTLRFEVLFPAVHGLQTRSATACEMICDMCHCACCDIRTMNMATRWASCVDLRLGATEICDAHTTVQVVSNLNCDSSERCGLCVQRFRFFHSVQ